MSWQRWPKLLAQRIEDRLGYKHELAALPDDQIGQYLEQKLAPISIQDFLIGVSPADLQADATLPDAVQELEDTD